MNSPHTTVRRPNWLLRYYGRQARVYLRVLRAMRILPAVVETSLVSRLPRSGRERGL
jgi:hypothetical protein